MRHTLILVFSLLVTCLAFSQGGFRVTYYVPNAVGSSAVDITELTKGKYIATAAGLNKVGQDTISQITLLGLDGAGKVEWTKTLGNLKLQYSYYPYGGKYGFSKDKFEFLTVPFFDSVGNVGSSFFKMDTLGNVLWERQFKEANFKMIPTCCVPSPHGGYILGGQIHTPDSIIPFLLRCDNQGHEVWRKFYPKNYPNLQFVSSILQEAKNGRIICAGGYVYASSPQLSQAASIMLMDSVGKLLDIKKNSLGIESDVCANPDGSYFVVGRREVNVWVSTYVSTLKKITITNSITEVWHKEYETDNVGNFFSTILNNKDGGATIIGSRDTASNNSDKFQALINYLRIDVSGNVVKARLIKINPLNADVFFTKTISANRTSDNGWCAAVKDFGTSDFVMFIKADSLGCDSSELYCKTVGLLNNQLPTLALKSNVVSKELCIEHLNGTSIVAHGVIDNLGRQYDLRLNSDQGHLSFDTSTLSPGLYTVFIETTKGRLASKFIKVNEN